MIAFFDTSVHVALLRGRVELNDVLAAAGQVAVRLSPVVASELLRGTSGKAARSVKQLVDRLVPLEPPSWRRCWLETGRLLPRVFRDHEAVGLARLQNDVLLALTARHTGALLLTADRSLPALCRQRSFVRLRGIA